VSIKGQVRIIIYSEPQENLSWGHSPADDFEGSCLADKIMDLLKNYTLFELFFFGLSRYIKSLGKKVCERDLNCILQHCGHMNGQQLIMRLK